MMKEAGVISTVCPVNIGLLTEKRHAYESAVAEAQSKLDAFPISKASTSQAGANERRTLVRRRNQAQAALHCHEERSRQELRNLINIVRKRAERRVDRGLDWLTAVWEIACKSRRRDEREESPFEYGEHRLLCLSAISRRHDCGAHGRQTHCPSRFPVWSTGR
jgi:inorganic triphosphatase YgiF